MRKTHITSTTRIQFDYAQHVLPAQNSSVIVMLPTRMPSGCLPQSIGAEQEDSPLQHAQHHSDCWLISTQSPLPAPQPTRYYHTPLHILFPWVSERLKCFYYSLILLFKLPGR